MDIGQRVKVFGGDGKTPLGLGRYQGDVTVYAFWSPDGRILSSDLCEEKPSAELMAEMDGTGALLDIMDNNPKLLLDSGRTVYGCQVWWSPVDEDAQWSGG